MKHDKFMNTAFQIAMEVPKTSDQKVAAIVVRNSSIISVGVNQHKTHPMVARANVDDWCEYLHAESSAIINAIRQISSKKLALCTLYVCRAKLIDGKDSWGLAKPCINCQEFMKHYPVKQVYYSTEKMGTYGWL